MKATAAIYSLLGLLVFSPVNSWAKSLNGTISAQSDTVHLELSGETNWSYDVKRVQKKDETQVEITVNALDETTVKSFSAFKSDLISAVSINKFGPDGKYVIILNLSGEEVDSFDYLTDQPSRLVVDFYVNNSQKVKSQPNAGSEKLPNKKIDLGSADYKLPIKRGKSGTAAKRRAPATADVLVLSEQGLDVAQNELPNIQTGVFDGGDPNYDRFSIKDYEIKEEAIIASKENYYIPFPMLQTQSNAYEKIKMAPAIYQIVPKSTDENKQARLLQTLFEKKRYAVFLKTLDWFRQKYPESEYSEIIDYMSADTHMALWREKDNNAEFEQGFQEYKTAIQRYPISSLSERTSLKLGFIALEKNDALRALRIFKEHIDNKNFDKKESFSKDLAHIGTGIAFAKLNRYEEAVQQFDNIEKQSTFSELKTEAAFRRADSFIQAKKYTQAVQEYQDALKRYPVAQTSFPNAYYNQAESLFNLDKFRESLDVYREFVKKFPTNEYAPFAMTRLGELLEILGADRTRVMGAYLEAFFRYGENPSVIVSRLRLLSGRMNGMKPKEVASAVEEIMSLAKKVELPNMDQFAHVMVADGYTSRGENQKSIDLLVKFYQQNPTTVDRNLITRRIIGNISNEIRKEVENGKFIQALRTHQKYDDSWLKNSQRLDIKFDIGRSFEMAGIPKEAKKYYQDALNQRYAMSDKEGKAAEIVEKLPSSDELNLRLSAIATQEQKFSQAYDHLKNIKHPEKLTDPQQIERVNLAVSILERRGDVDSAVRYLTELLKTWKGQPELVAGPYLKLSELELKQNKKEDAIQTLAKIDEMMKDSEKVPAEIHIKALQSLGDLYLEKGQQEKAITTYERLLNKYEEKSPLASLRYKLGEVHFKRGEVQKAAATWNEFKGTKSDFWKNLAQEQLKNSEWQDGFRKYIKRIPAMSEDK